VHHGGTDSLKWLCLHVNVTMYTTVLGYYACIDPMVGMSSCVDPHWPAHGDTDNDATAEGLTRRMGPHTSTVQAGNLINLSIYLPEF
jgi:hypothetical protein